MATEVPGLVLTFAAGEDLSSNQYYPVRLEADGQIDIAGASVGEDAIGIVQNKPSVVGAAATVMVSGVSKAVAGTGGTTAGVRVQAIADGVTDAASGDYVIGIALDTAAAGVITRVLLGGGGSNHLNA